MARMRCELPFAPHLFCKVFHAAERYACHLLLASGLPWPTLSERNRAPAVGWDLWRLRGHNGPETTAPPKPPTTATPRAPAVGWDFWRLRGHHANTCWKNKTPKQRSDHC